MIEIQLTPSQLEVANDLHRFKIICAGRRFGKSTLARMLILQMALRNPGLYWIVSPTYTQSVQNHWRELIKEFPRELIARKYEGRSITLLNGSVIELKGADNPDALRGVKLRGLVVDEIASIRDWNWLWQEVLRATLTDYSAPAIFISTPKGYNHFYELFNLGQRTDGLYKSWRFSSYDNPTIPKHDIDAAKDDLLEDVFAQEYLADFRKYTGLVYKEFDRAIHVKVLSDFESVYYIRGLDRGFTNPTAVPIIGVNKDGDWYQTHELYKTGLTNPALSNELRALDQQLGITEYEYETMDSAAASDIIELNQLDHPFIGVIKQSRETNINYVSYKIRKFSERLHVNSKTHRPRYYVHPRNEKTIWEFETYAWPEKKDQLSNEIEQPLKLNDHMMDALADLNAMYSHFYEASPDKIGSGKIPGTYIPPADETLDANFAQESDNMFIDDGITD